MEKNKIANAINIRTTKQMLRQTKCEQTTENGEFVKYYMNNNKSKQNDDKPDE
jgi:hypothetical protein